MDGGDTDAAPVERRRWWLLFLLMTVAAGTWSLGVPLMTGHDEASQAIRSASAARGNLFGAPQPGSHNALVRLPVPEAYGQSEWMNYCFLGRPFEWFQGMPARPAHRQHCPAFEGGRTIVSAQTNQQRNPPAYPIVQGLPTLAFPSQLGAYLMRLVGAVICAGLLASGLVTVARFRIPRLAALAALAVVTPEVVYVAGTSNTAGLEMAASFALWAAALALALGPGAPDRRLVRRAGVALVLLVLARPMSPAFALIALAVAAFLATPERRRAVWARRDVRRWLIAGGLAAATTVTWLVVLEIRRPVPASIGTGLGDAVGLVPWWMRGMVGVFGSTDVIPPAALHVAWGAVTVAVLTWALTRAPARAALVSAGLIVGGLALLISGQGFGIPDTGFWWQGRYVVPLLMGGVLTASAAARPDGDRPTAPGRSGPLLAGLLAGLHVWAFLYAVRHYAVGYGGTANPLRYLTDPVWSPPYGPDLLFAALFAAAVGLAAAVVWRSAAVAPAAAPPPGDEPVPVGGLAGVTG
jgi:Predicted membrane protein (DUF2142)